MMIYSKTSHTEYFCCRPKFFLHKSPAPRIWNIKTSQMEYFFAIFALKYVIFFYFITFYSNLCLYKVQFLLIIAFEVSFFKRPKKLVQHSPFFATYFSINGMGSCPWRFLSNNVTSFLYL